MKKILAMMLTAAMMLSMSAAVMADDVNIDNPNGPFEDEPTVTITKTYKLVGNGVSPAETFNFTITEKSVTGNDAATFPDKKIPVNDEAGNPEVDEEGNPVYETVDWLPEITPVVAAEGDATAAGKEYPITITLPEYTEVGVYTYEFTETDNNVAGVTYYEKTMTLVVTVVQEGTKVRVAAVHCEEPASPSYAEGSTKTDGFENTYSAETLTINKTLVGNMAEKDQYFTVVVTFNAPAGDTIASNALTYNKGELSNENNPPKLAVGENTLYIKGGETIVIENIPYDVTYTVVETEANQNGYTTTYTLDGETVDTVESAIGEENDETPADTVVITNSKTTEVDTGISVDSIPYIAMLGVVAVGGAGVVVSKKRRSED